MNEAPGSKECAAVRDALLSGSFDQIGREQVEQHLNTHRACAKWASKTLLLRNLLAIAPRQPQPSGEINDFQLAAYLDGNLAAADRRRVADACCHDLRLAGRLSRLQSQRLQEGVAAQAVHPGQVVACPESAAGQVMAETPLPADNPPAVIPRLTHSRSSVAGFACALLAVAIALAVAIPGVPRFVILLTFPLLLAGLAYSIAGLVTAHTGHHNRSLALTGLLCSLATAFLGVLCILEPPLVMVTLNDARTTASGPEKPADDKANVDPNRWAVQPPKLAAIQDQTVDQGSQLQLLVPVEQRGSASHLVYSLAAGKPEGAQVDPQSGLFSWAPTPAQRPGTYPITVQVSAPELGDVRDQSTFRVHLREVNRPPRLMPLSDTVSVDPGKPLRIHFQAADPDQPRDKLTFSLINRPEGAQLDPVSGDFTWTPTSEQAGTHSVTVRVTDDRPGTLYDEKHLTITVNRPMPPPATSLAAKDAYFRLEFSSDRTLTSEMFKDLERKARTDAASALSLYLKNRLVPVPDVLVYCDSSPEVISGIISLKDGNLEGPTIAFHNPRGSDTRKPTAPYAEAPHLPDAPPQRYVTFHSKEWEGWLATWNERGEKQYCCEYSRGKRNGLCCLFKEDRLAMVLECQADAVQTVHLITANEIAKSFDNAEQAQADSAAGPLLQEINETGNKLKADGLNFKKTTNQVIDARIAMISIWKRKNVLNQYKLRDLENWKDLQDRMKDLHAGKATR